jgi:glycerophosphoryl diester phosphodiesterase
MRTAPHTPAWWLRRLRLRLLTPERSLRSLEACDGLRSSPRAAPKTWTARYQAPGVDLEADASIVTPELVEWLHARGKLVAVWVFRAPAKNDTPELWAAMRDAGVDFFTSNLPHELTAWRTAS